MKFKKSRGPQKSRKIILDRVKKAAKKIREQHALEEPNPYDPIYPPHDEDLVQTFTTQLSRINGHAIQCKNNTGFLAELKNLADAKNWESIHVTDPELKELLENANLNITEDFKKAKVGITCCELLVAHLGSVIVSSQQTGGRRMNVFFPTHLIVAGKNQLRKNLDEAIKSIKDKYGTQLPSMITNIAGPSRTADIEKTLIMGAHGPKDIYVFIVNN